MKGVDLPICRILPRSRVLATRSRCLLLPETVTPMEEEPGVKGMWILCLLCPVAMQTLGTEEARLPDMGRNTAPCGA